MRIPIQAAKDIAKKYKQQQVIIVTWDGTTSQVATFGGTLEQSDQAAQGGNRVKAALGWPDDLCHAEPARVRRAREKKKR